MSYGFEKCKIFYEFFFSFFFPVKCFLVSHFPKNIFSKVIFRETNGALLIVDGDKCKWYTYNVYNGAKYDQMGT